MFKAEKVLWGEGLFLRPQHFQLQDAYHEQRLNQMIQATFPFAYGIQVIEFDEEKIEQLRNNPNIIRNKLKIKASISNAKIFKSIQEEYQTFYNYLCTFTHGKIIYETGKTTSTLSDSISNDLKKRGMKFVGSTIIYSFLQAIGVIYSHEKDCFLYKD